MKVKLLEATVVNGGVWGKDAIVEVSDAEGAAMIAQGKAVVVSMSALKAPVASPANKEPEK